MLAGAGAVDITPPIGLPMGGNVRSDAAARGVHDELRASALLLDDEQGGKALLVGLDLVAVSATLSTGIRNVVERRCGIPAEQTVVFATHTHSGPDVLLDEGWSGAIRSAELERWLDAVPALVAEAAEAAVESLQPASLAVTTVDAPGYAFNRRLRMRDGATRMNWEPLDPAAITGTLGPTDPELAAAIVRGRSGETVAVLVTFALHAAVLVGKDWAYSRDWVGPFEDALQEELGADVPVLYASGAMGNVNHLDAFAGESRPQSFEECRRIGRGLAAQLVPGLTAAAAADDVSVGVHRVGSELRLRPITDEMLARANEVIDRSGGRIPSQLDGIPEEAYAARVLRMAPDHSETCSIEPALVEIGPLVLACVPGEAFVEFGLALRRRHPERIVRVVSLADGYVGYLPTEAAFEQGGYEPTFGTSTIRAGEGERLFDRLSDAVTRLATVAK